MEEEIIQKLIFIRIIPILILLGIQIMIMYWIGGRGKWVLLKFLDYINNIFRMIFRGKKLVKLGIYGPINVGKTTLANRICKDWIGEELGTVSKIPHETREIQVKEKVKIRSNSKELDFNIIDTPGIATKIDYEDFMKFKLSEKESKARAKEATKGVIEAIKWLENVDAVLVVLDATENPYNQVNITIIGNLAARNITTR